MANLFTQELMEDIHIQDKQNWIAFNNYLAGGNYNAAKAILNANPSLVSKIFDQNRFNKQSDGLIAIEQNINDNTEGYLNNLLVKQGELIDNYQNKGLWNNANEYQQNNLVYDSNGDFYFAKTNIPAGSELSYDGWLKLDLTGDKGVYGTGFTWRGEYASSTTYQKNNVVRYNNALYISKTTTTSVPTNTTDWYLLWTAPTEVEKFEIINKQITKTYDTIVGTFNVGERKVGEGIYMWNGQKLQKGKIWFVIEEVNE